MKARLAGPGGLAAGPANEELEEWADLEKDLDRRDCRAAAACGAGASGRRLEPPPRHVELARHARELLHLVQQQVALLDRRLVLRVLGVGPRRRDDAADLVDSLLATPVVRCDDVPWSLFGLSMAGWNMLLSVDIVALATLSFIFGGRFGHTAS